MTNLDYLYNPDAAKDICDNHFVDKKLSFQVIERGTILPNHYKQINGKTSDIFGGIVDGKGEYIRGSHVYHSIGSAYTPAEKVEYVPMTVVYLGLLCGVWGHAITDSLRRLWFLKDESFLSNFKNCPLVYITYGGEDVFSQVPNFKRLPEILELDIGKWKRIDRPVQFENIILPDESFFGENDRFFTSEYHEMIDRVKNFALKNRTPTSSKKIYFHYGVNQTGAERLAEYFKSKNYKPVSPELLTFDEQLNLLINAESFASTLGSCAHNSLFLREGTEAIFIPRTANRFTNYYQAAINQLNNLNAVYIDSALSLFGYKNPAYCFIISRQLKNFFGDEFNGYSEEDFKTFLEYVKVCINNGLEINRDSEKYYGEVLQDFLLQLGRREDLTTEYGLKFYWE